MGNKAPQGLTARPWSAPTPPGAQQMRAIQGSAAWRTWHGARVGKLSFQKKKTVVCQERPFSPVDARISAPEAGVRRAAWAEVTRLRQAAPAPSA